MLPKKEQAPSGEAILTYLGKVLSEENQEAIAKKLFIKLWNDACSIENRVYGKYNENTGYFELNDIKDIDYDEAIRIYQLLPHSTIINLPNGCTYNPTANHQVRTIMPIILKGSYNYNLKETFWGTQFEVIQLAYASGHRINNLSGCFAKCSNLIKIKGEWNLQECDSDGLRNVFDGSNKVESFQFYYLNGDFNIGNLQNIDKDSLSYLIYWAMAKKSCTVTVHPSVYAKLTDPGNTEWNKLLTDAAEKQISFATAA